MASTLKFIDADAHLNPPPMFWDDYLPAKYKGRGPKIIPGSNTENHDWVEFEGTRKALSFFNSKVGPEKDFKILGRESDLRKGSYEPSTRLKDMDDDGVDTAVMFGGGPLGSADTDLFIESFRAYNRWAADFCSYNPQRLVAAAYLPMFDVDESVEMLKEAAKLGARAVNIPAYPMKRDGIRGSVGFAAQVLSLTGDPHGDLQYYDPIFDPFWKAAVDHDVAITIHLGARVPSYNLKSVSTMQHMVMSKLCMAEPITVMIFAGIFDRFPTLRFGAIESQVGWFAWFAQYMDSVWDNQGHWMKSMVTNIKHEPSYYMDQNVYGSFMRDPIGIKNRHEKGGKNIMWSTDYPHSESTWPHSRALAKEFFKDVSEEDKRTIVYENARRFYGL